MKLTDEERKQVVLHRLQRSKETLQEAKTMVESEHWNGAINRLYYACYYVANALLIKHGHIARTHSGIISLLGLHFVSKGLISEEQGSFYGNLFTLRQTGDYNDWITLEPEDVLSKIVPAEEFIATVEKLVLLPQAEVEKTN
jgi:uncharacterized protein (UPF0332 family)